MLLSILLLFEQIYSFLFEFLSLLKFYCILHLAINATPFICIYYNSFGNKSVNLMMSRQTLTRPSLFSPQRWTSIQFWHSSYLFSPLNQNIRAIFHDINWSACRRPWMGYSLSPDCSALGRLCVLGTECEISKLFIRFLGMFPLLLPCSPLMLPLGSVLLPQLLQLFLPGFIAPIPNMLFGL